MKIGILSLSDKLYSTKRLVEELSKLNHNVTVISPSLNMSLLPNIDMLIPRVGMTNIENSLAIIKYYKLNNVPLYNDFDEISLCKNKWLMYQKLKSLGCHIPHTVLVNKKNVLQNTLHYPFVLKILHGSQGYGVHKVDNITELNQALLKTPEDQFLLQEFVDQIYQGEYRAFINNKKILAKIKKTPQDNNFKANAHQNARLTPIKDFTQPELYELTKIISAFKLNLMSIDYVLANNLLIIMEVNQSPGFESLEAQCKVDIAQQIAKSIDSIQLSSLY